MKTNYQYVHRMVWMMVLQITLITGWAIVADKLWSVSIFPFLGFLWQLLMTFELIYQFDYPCFIVGPMLPEAIPVAIWATVAIYFPTESILFASLQVLFILRSCWYIEIGNGDAYQT